VIEIRQRIVPRSRTHTGSLWEASTEIDGKTYSTTSRHGAPQALARVLVAAGIADQPIAVRSEVCVLDTGAEIRTEQLRGCISYRSLHAMAKWTFTEGAATLLHRVRYQEQPEGVFSVEASGQEVQQAPRRVPLGGTPAVTPKSAIPAPALRHCKTCGDPFRPWRPQAEFCSGKCRQKAWRQGANPVRLDKVAE
jgi:hypothetical protein